MRGLIWWLGLKYVTSQRTFCGLYVVCRWEFGRLPSGYALYLKIMKPLMKYIICDLEFTVYTSTLRHN